ncbi:unnamed protein product [Chrysoparadoxa australica]
MALGGYVPDAPLGINDKRWSTALVIVYLRRKPELFEHVYPTYSRGVKWAEDTGIMKMAHEMLPPEEVYFPLDDTAVKGGHWMEHTQKLLGDAGHGAFVMSADQRPLLCEMSKSVSYEEVASPEEEEEKFYETIGKMAFHAKQGHKSLGVEKYAMHHHDPDLQRDHEEGLEMELSCTRKATKSCYKMGEIAECRWRRPNRLENPCVDALNWHTATITKIHDCGRMDVRFCDGLKERCSKVMPCHVRKRTRASSDDGGHFPATTRHLYQIGATTAILQENWHNTPPLRQELKRLGKYRAVKRRSRPEWDTRAPLIAFELSKRQPLGPSTMLTKTRKPRPREPFKGKRKPRHMGKAQPCRLPDGAINTLEGEVVRKIMARDAYLAEVKGCLARALAEHKAARTKREQQTCFDELKAMLGFYQPARPGYTDWHGREVIGLQDLTIAAVDAVHRWQLSMLDHHEGEEVEGQKLLPFVWEGEDFLHGVINQCDFLGQCEEIVDWFGPDFPYKHNPFSMAYALDDRPVTPRSALVKTWLDGELTEVISTLLLEERSKELEALALTREKQVRAMGLSCVRWVMNIQ